MPSAQLWNCLCYSSALNIYVTACGFSFGTGSNVVAYSGTGTYNTWTQTTLTASLHWVGIARSTNLTTNYFVAISNSVNSTPKTGAGAGSNIFNYSADGITWSSTTVPNTLEWSEIIYVPQHKRFYVISVGTTATPTTVFLYSTNGTSWTAGTCPSGQWTSIIYIPDYDRLVICSYTGIIRYSDDKGVTWNVSSVPSANGFFQLCYSPDYKMICCVSANGIYRITFSTDGGINFFNGTTTFSKLMTLCSYGAGRFALGSGDNLTYNVYANTLEVANTQTNMGTLGLSDVSINGDVLNVTSTNTNVSGIMNITSQADSSGITNSLSALNVSGGASIAKTCFCKEINAVTYSSPTNAFRHNLYSGTSVQGISAVTVTQVNFPTTITNGLGSAITVTGNNSFFNTSSTSLKLLITYSVRGFSSAASANECWISINGASGLAYGNNTGYSAAGDGAMSGTAILDLAVGSYFSVYAYFPTGNTISSNASTYASVLGIYSLN
jgi:hypothetical protein